MDAQGTIEITDDATAENVTPVSNICESCQYIMSGWERYALATCQAMMSSCIKMPALRTSHACVPYMPHVAQPTKQHNTQAQ